MKTPICPTTPISVEKFIPGGQTLGTLPDGRKIFFWGALPGETVTACQITKQKSHYLEAIATAVEQPSPHRITPADSCYLSTSPWQILDYPYELATKRELLAEQFRQAGVMLPLALSPSDCQSATSAPAASDCQPALAGTDCQSIPPVATDGRDLHYRNKMEYALYYSHDDAQIHLAFHARGSHRKIPIEQSSIERPEIWQAATAIVHQLNASHADSRAYQSLLLRCDQQGTVSGGLYENHRPHPVFSQLTDTLLGHPYSYSPGGFFQINLPVYELALTAIAQHISTPKVLDLYSGVGSIGLSVAADRVLTLVECDASAYRELERNVKSFSENISDLNASRRISLTDPTGSPLGGGSAGVPEHDVENVQVVREKTILRSFQAKSEDALDFITEGQTVILDPPRAGCHPALLERLLAVKPPTIIYLSCNPATQARDIKILAKYYTITSIQPFNFFPRTPHLENLVVLSVK